MIKVLIVEDDPMVRMINEKFLEKVEGFDLIGSVDNVKNAKKFLETNSADLVLLDVFLPGEKGLELLKWMRENHLDTDVIMITADKNIKTVEDAFRIGVVDYLIKPFTYERFSESLLKYRQRCEAILNIETVDQEDIDKYLLNEKKGELFHQDKKKNNSNTFEHVMEFFKENKETGYTAMEIADALGFSRITARRYLDVLEKQGYLDLHFEYGTVGRPKNVYRFREK